MKQLFIILLLILPAIFFSETQTSVSVSTTTATIGEQIILKFIIRTSAESDSIRISQEKQEFEFIKEGELTTIRDKGITTFEKNFKISFFKTGDFSVGPFNISLTNRDQVIETLASNTIPVNIRSILEENEKDIKPLRELLEIDGHPFYLLKYIILLFVAAGIILLIIYLIRRKKKRGIETGPPSLPPDVEFLKKLESLWRTDMLKKGKVKMFFLTLTEAYKLFMTRSYRFNASDLTTYEIIDNLRKYERDEGIRKNFERVFLLSDLAKFAKYIPTTDEVEGIRNDLTKIAEMSGEKRRKREEEEKSAAL